MQSKTSNGIEGQRCETCRRNRTLGSDRAAQPRRRHPCPRSCNGSTWTCRRQVLTHRFRHQQELLCSDGSRTTLLRNHPRTMLEARLFLTDARARPEEKPIALSTIAPLRRSSQCALIIRHKFLDTLGCEFMCDVKALPWKVQIQLFVRDRLQKLATGIKPSVPEILIRHWKACCRPFV